MGPETHDHDPENGQDEPLVQEDYEQDDGPQASTPGGSDMHIESSSSSVRNSQSPMPVWLRESSKSFHWRWVPVQIRQAARWVADWSKGPDPPQIQKITPFFPMVQEAPAKFIETYFPNRKHKIGLLGFFYFCWLLTFILVLHHSTKTGRVGEYGKPQAIWCGASFWGANNECGLNGNRCRPFNNASFAFRCPADCRRIQVLNPRAVGDQELIYQPFVIGGPTLAEANASNPDTLYRGDSFICQAAIHSGLVGNEDGGCGVASLVGEGSNFVSTERHGIQSIGFDSNFPKSFTFVSGLPTTCSKDLRWPLLAVTCGFTTILSLCTTSPPVFFFSTFVILFFHVGLVSDTPNYSDYASLISLIVGRFLPAAFVAYVLYRVCVKQQQTGLTANVERTVLWLGGAWVGALNNYTFIYIPLHRLTPHDVQAQKGAVLAIVIVVLIIFSIALGQAWYLRQEGRFRQYLAIYVAMGAGLLLAVALPWHHLRIHHYFLAILLLPGTRMQTRPGMLFQGLLFGLFINGIARWGFDSIMQTTAELRGDGQFGSLLPNITAPVLGTSNITFSWSTPPQPYDGVSVLVNDVERHKWYYGEGSPSHTFDRYEGVEKEYFRFAFLQGGRTGDFTNAGVWNGNGSWTQMEPGPS